jgi:hypothetical protein
MNTTPNVTFNFNDSLPKEKTSSIIYLNSEITWKSYNGIMVNWPKSPQSLTGTYDEIILPAGPARLVFDLTSRKYMGNITAYASGQDLVFTYNLKPQVRYVILYPVSGDNVWVYELAEGKSVGSLASSKDYVKVKVGEIK